MELKDRILQKANDLFHRYGVRSITMDEIASQLGVSKKTIYQYYSDKDELVDRVTAEVIGNAQFNCENLKAGARNAIHEIFQVIDFIRNMFTQMNPAMVFDLNRFHPKAYNLFLNYKNQFLYQMIKENLERGIREGLYRPEINVEIIVKLRLEGMLIAFNQDIFPPSKYNLAEIQQAVIEHFLFGVASLKGYRLILKYQKESLKAKK
ncbi:MAG TPA: TetR/AcrR family transcriptional regulator [Flavitalea sp.]|nr:TetR/AcrR family transcriptional regulator [Flavitalea sp.]